MLGPIERKRMVLRFLKWCHFILRFSYSCKTLSTKNQDLLVDLLFHCQIESDFRFLFLILSGSENWRGFVMSEPLIGRFFSFEFWLLCDWLLLFTVYFWPDDAECRLIPKLGYFGRKNIFFTFGNIFGFQFLVIRRICYAKYNGIKKLFWKR